MCWNLVIEIPTLILQGSPPRDVWKSLTSPGNTHAEKHRVRIKGPSLHRKKEKTKIHRIKQITLKDRYVSFAASVVLPLPRSTYKMAPDERKSSKANNGQQWYSFSDKRKVKNLKKKNWKWKKQEKENIRTAKSMKKNCNG